MYHPVSHGIVQSDIANICNELPRKNEQHSNHNIREEVGRAGLPKRLRRETYFFRVFVEENSLLGGR